MEDRWCARCGHYVIKDGATGSWWCTSERMIVEEVTDGIQEMD